MKFKTQLLSFFILFLGFTNLHAGVTKVSSTASFIEVISGDEYEIHDFKATLDLASITLRTNADLGMFQRYGININQVLTGDKDVDSKLGYAWFYDHKKELQLPIKYIRECENYIIDIDVILFAPFQLAFNAPKSQVINLDVVSPCIYKVIDLLSEKLEGKKITISKRVQLNIDDLKAEISKRVIESLKK